MEKPTQRGRPAGKLYPHLKVVRLDDEGQRELSGLARKWRVSEAEAARRAIREAAEREGVE